MVSRLSYLYNRDSQAKNMGFIKGSPVMTKVEYWLQKVEWHRTGDSSETFYATKIQILQTQMWLNCLWIVS